MMSIKALPHYPSQKTNTAHASDPTVGKTGHRSTVEIIHGNDLNNTDMLVRSKGDLVVLEAVAKDFGIDQILRVRYPVHFSTTSKKAIIETTTGNFFVKQKADYASSEENLMASGEFQNFLGAEMPKQVVPLLRTSGGLTYSSFGSKQYIVMPEVCAGTFIGHLGQIEDAGKILALIHNNSVKFYDKHSSLIPEYSDSQAEAIKFIQLAAEISSHSKDTHREHALNQLKFIVSKYDSDYHWSVPRLLAHGDFSPSNLFFEDDTVKAVLDFDNVAFHARIRDLAHGVLTFCGGINYSGASSSLRAPISVKIQTDLATAFFDSYQQNLCAPMSSKERRFLVNEIVLIWVEHMALGILRGDFGFKSIIDGLAFVGNIEQLRYVFEYR